ncbi:ribonuclease T1 [Saccharopolyspora lacisalsi]|uniref:Ribonuclease T1 n=1 Tax=Halosaccharopolyspora lacisalsi TaxID=1000566 RepID=A0A839DMN6_9PSEU|nr:ribonuclease [Halosaccharopolyspora lacisalsi]MBA8823222.1 ribonuclease T1 [Halosaccharopolyspora lacisalsi]
MRHISIRAARTLLAGLITVVGVLGFHAGVASAVAPAPTPAPITAPAAQPECGDLSGFEQVALSDLPPEATDTVRLIQRGGPYPYPQDGGVFHNREGILPDCSDGYYHEYTVETPGSDDRGARRFVVGSNGEYFYTADHYESFRSTDINA